MRISASLLAFFVILAAAGAALSQGRFIETYVARLSDQDHVTSGGERLSTVAAILRQDRANFHRFDQPDDEDEPDTFFTERENRGALERLVSRGNITPDVRRAIISGTPLVRVTVHGRRVDVEILEE